MKFTKSKFEDMLHPGQVKVRYITEDFPTFSMTCTGMGVEISGTLSARSNDELQDFAKGLSDAWKDHLKLSFELKKSLAL